MNSAPFLFVSGVLAPRLSGSWDTELLRNCCGATARTTERCRDPLPTLYNNASVKEKALGRFSKGLLKVDLQLPAWRNYLRSLRRIAPAIPNSPVLSKAMLAGSGTGGILSSEATFCVLRIPSLPGGKPTSDAK